MRSCHLRAPDLSSGASTADLPSEDVRSGYLRPCGGHVRPGGLSSGHLRSGNLPSRTRSPDLPSAPHAPDLPSGTRAPDLPSKDLCSGNLPSANVRAGHLRSDDLPSGTRSSDLPSPARSDMSAGNLRSGDLRSGDLRSGCE